MPWSNQEIRKLLSLLGKPNALESFPLAVQLKGALGCASAREAVLAVIERAFEVRTPLNGALRDCVLRYDLEGNKSLGAAAALNVSPRTFFRWRAAAIKAIASAVDQTLHAADSPARFKYAIARMIAPLESVTAAHLLEIEAATMGGRAAYDAICAELRNGREVSDALLDRCTDHWRLLAQLEIARAKLVHGNPADYETLRSQIRSALDRVQGVDYERVEFELAYTDRLNAIRVCDVEASGMATRRMSETAGSDPSLVTLALVCEAEQACDEGDLARAGSVLRKLESLCVRIGDFRGIARTSHVAAILQFLRCRYAEAIELANATTAALKQVEPEFAACSAGNAGRAALFVGQPWKRPLDLCSRFPESYVTGYVDAVWARHLALSDPESALSVIDRTINTTSAQGAWGVLTYARGTRSLILDRLCEQHSAQAERVWTWEKAIQMRRVFYLHDLFVHPAGLRRALGSFELDDRFEAAIGRRFQTLCAGSLDSEDVATWLQQAVLPAVRHGAGSTEHGVTKAASATVRWTRPLSALAAKHHVVMERCAADLARDLSICVAPPERPGFIERTCAAFASLGREWLRQTAR